MKSSKTYQLNKTVFAIALGTVAWTYFLSLDSLGLPSYWSNLVWLLPLQALVLGGAYWKLRKPDR